MNTKILKSSILVCLVMIVLGFSSCSSDVTIENRAPNAFGLTQPTEGADGVGAQPQLSWEAATDPDGDFVTYQVYLDTQNPPQSVIASDLGVNTYNLENELDLETIYYWKILAKDSHGNATESDVASFVTRDMTTAEAIVGKWHFESIENEPELNECFIKSYVKFTEDSEVFSTQYDENNEGECISESSGGSYEFIGDDKIEVDFLGFIETWKIISVSKNNLVVEIFDDFELTLKKE